MWVIKRLSSFIAGTILVASLVAGVGMGAAHAQQQPTPAQLMQQNPEGGSRLVSAIENLLVFGSFNVQDIYWLGGDC